MSIIYDAFQMDWPNYFSHLLVTQQSSSVVTDPCSYKIFEQTAQWIYIRKRYAVIIFTIIFYIEIKAVPLRVWTYPSGSRRWNPEFLDSRYKKASPIPPKRHLLYSVVRGWRNLIFCSHSRRGVPSLTRGLFCLASLPLYLSSKHIWGYSLRDRRK